MPFTGVFTPIRPGSAAAGVRGFVGGGGGRSGSRGASAQQTLLRPAGEQRPTLVGATAWPAARQQPQLQQQQQQQQVPSGRQTPVPDGATLTGDAPRCGGGGAALWRYDAARSAKRAYANARQVAAWGAPLPARVVPCDVLALLAVGPPMPNPPAAAPMLAAGGRGGGGVSGGALAIVLVPQPDGSLLAVPQQQLG